MPTPKNSKPEPLRVIGSRSKLVGAMVGTAVVTGKRAIRSVRSSSEGSSDKPGEKTVHAPVPTKRKKKAVRKAGIKIPKTKKKKVVKRKGTGSSGESGASKKKSTKSPAKKKKTANSEGSSHSQDGLISEIDTGTNVPIGKQEPQL